MPVTFSPRQFYLDQLQSNPDEIAACVQVVRNFIGFMFRQHPDRAVTGKTIFAQVQGAGIPTPIFLAAWRRMQESGEVMGNEFISFLLARHLADDSQEKNEFTASYALMLRCFDALIPFGTPEKVGNANDLGVPKGTPHVPKGTPASTPSVPKGTPFNQAAGFDEAWKSYPRKEGSKAARRYYVASVKSAEDHARLMSAIRAYATSEAATKDDGKFCKHGSTFFNNWNDYVPVVQTAERDKEAWRRRQSLSAALNFNRDPETGLKLTEEQRAAFELELKGGAR